MTGTKVVLAVAGGVAVGALAVKWRELVTDINQRIDEKFPPPHPSMVLWP